MSESPQNKCTNCGILFPPESALQIKFCFNCGHKQVRGDQDTCKPSSSNIDTSIDINDNGSSSEREKVPYTFVNQDKQPARLSDSPTVVPRSTGHDSSGADTVNQPDFSEETLTNGKQSESEKNDATESDKISLVTNQNGLEETTVSVLQTHSTEIDNAPTPVDEHHEDDHDSCSVSDKDRCTSEERTGAHSGNDNVMDSESDRFLTPSPVTLTDEIEREGTVSPPSTENVEIHKRPGELKEVIDAKELQSESDVAVPTITSVNVTFHAMVQLTAWNWNDDSFMTIRFGDPRLGGWASEKGLLVLKRRFDDGLVEFQCTLLLPVDLTLNKSVVYRYLIHSHRDETSVDPSDLPYEYLLWNDVQVCRCMMMEDFSLDGEYHQFDGIVLPEPKSWLGLKALKYFTSSQDSLDKNFYYYQEKSLLHYLDDMKNILINCGLSQKFGIHSATEKTLYLFNQLFLSKVQVLQRRQRERVPIHVRIAKQLPEAFKTWLLSVVKALRKKIVKSAEENAFRMASVVVVIQCFCGVMPSPQLPFESLTVANYSSILSMFWPMADLISHKSLDLEILSNLIQPNEIAVAKGLITFCKHLAHSKHLKAPEWLYAIPLIHFLTKQSVPFEKPEKKYNKIIWEDAHLELARLRRERTAMKTNLGVVKKLFKDLKPLGVLDPLFLPLFVLLCPEKELPELFLEIPLYLSGAFMLLIIRDRNITELEVSYLTKLLQSMLTVVKQQSKDSDLECLESTLESSRIIYMRLMRNLPLTVKDSSSAIRKSASLLFYTITMLKVQAPDVDTRTLVEEQTKELIQAIHKEIKGWIQKKFGSRFGSPVGTALLLCADEELEICQSLHQLDCPQLILESWRAVIIDMIKQRIQRIPMNKRIDLFCVLETQKVVDQSIISLFMIAAMESLRQMELTDTAQSVERLYRGTSKQRETVGKIMESIVVLKYPLGTETITFDQLLEWELWPCFIKIFSSEPKGGKTVSCLPEHCALLSACAQSILLSACENLSTGDVVVKDLEKMTQRRDQMERLCSVTNVWKGLKKQHPKEHLSRRLKECENFTARQELLTFLCNQVTVPVVGLDELKSELGRDYSQYPINTLCTSIGRKGSIEYLSCESATPLETIMVKFRIMAGENSNDVFRKIWLKVLNSVRTSSTELTLEGIVNHLWEPAFEECKMLLDSIREQTILLSVVDNYFLQYNDEKRIVAHLFSLYTGVEMCLNNRKPSGHPGWLRYGVHLMLQYWKLCQYAKAAKVVLNVSQKLKITGDFSLMTTLATKGTSDMKSKPLSSIDETLINAGSFLEDFRDEQKLDCLRTFVDCADIIEWIRTYTKEVNELHRFVSIALHTAAGEGDYESDKLATLRTVATAFEPLIYGLKGDITYEIFCEKCRSVWDELRKNPKLPKMLRTCSDELEWYKSLKDTQDSVTSYGEMNNILKHGIYRVGSRSSTAIKTDFQDVISMKLRCTDKRITKRQYSFSELQDLESKLVLITGSKAKNRKEVDLFLDIFHGVYRVADALVSLQRNGNIKYWDWKMEVACEPDKVEALATQAKQMEDELEVWKEEVKRVREKYYELNYFTTRQLIVLRKDLGVLKSPRANAPGPAVSPTVLALLQSVSEKVNGIAVVKAVRDVALMPVESWEPSSPSLAATTSQDQTLFNSHINDEPLDAKGTSSVIKPFVKKGKKSSHNLCSLKPDKLSTEQKEIFMYVVERFAFPQLLVLKALEECKGDANKYDVQNWCLENSEKYQFHDEDSNDEAIESDIVNEETVSLYHGGQSSSVLGWFGHSLMNYITLPRKRQDMAKPLQSSPPILKKHINIPGLTVFCDSKVDEHFLSLEHLGMMLKRLPASASYQRSFKTSIFKVGCPNLIVTSPRSVLKTVLSLYMEDESLPLPTLEEVLFCNSSTTAEEVTLLWIRSIKDSPSFNRIFVLVHAEKLSYQVSDKVLQSLMRLSQNQSGYRLVIVCSNENEEKSLIITKLHNCRRQFAEPTNDNQIKQYLKAHFTAYLKSMPSHASAASVDHDGSYVRVVSSNRSGMGKSFYIQQMAQSLKKKFGKTSAKFTIPIHGPEVTPDTVMNFLCNHLRDPPNSMYHIDISSDVLWKVDTILFSLLILHGLTDSQGRIWRTRRTQYIAIEATLPKKEVSVGNSHELGISSLLNLLPTANCPSPDEVLKLRSRRHGVFPKQHNEPLEMPMDLGEFRSDRYQRVYQYLQLYSGNKRGNIDRFCYNHQVEGDDKDCLQLLLRNCGVADPSWREIRHFVEFLNIQLRSCEGSVYTNEALVGDILAGLKRFVVRFMITMSKDFATPFLEGEVTRNNQRAIGELGQYRIDSSKVWERSIHPYIFFNQTDDGTITFVGFKVTRDGDLVHPIKGTTLEHRIMSPELFSGLERNGVNFSEDYTKWGKPVMIEKLASVMGVEPIDPDTSYVLTMDNIIKILAIHMRFRCNIPVVIMGETGCGKTRLIRYMSELARQDRDVKNMFILKVHGGTTENDVKEFVSVVEKEAKRNMEQGIDTIAFFDEANTTDAIGLIKEVMCDCRMNGRPIFEHLKFIAACNPYRKYLKTQSRHNDRMIERLKNAGLGFYVRDSETTDKLGSIPLRHLVYRVLNLPQSMRPLVYDFGQLKSGTEFQYTCQVVANHVYSHKTLRSEGQATIKAIAGVLTWSQDYMRKREDECSFVSLRDVERAMIVLIYFYNNMNTLSPLIDSQKQKELAGTGSQSPNDLTRALLLSLSVCYHARLQHRLDYEEGVAAQFKHPLNLPGKAEQLRNEIRWCQEVLLDNMRLGENIAKNAALRENVFMMAVCVELRIPLFIVGKPGSSKSLAKSIVQESMKGKSSRNRLMKHFKEVDVFSYQCSQLSTSESVIDVFTTAKKIQQKQDISRYVAVVVLDEVGLAEDSPNLPLKALHPLLEDGTEGGGHREQRNFQDKIVSREERVAFIGISNWALDPAKMNRGVMVTRGDPSEHELELSARGICSNKENDPVRERLEEYFQPLARSYLEICKKQHRQFFGLRDFYSLIKMLYWMCAKSGNPPTWPQFEHAIRRNFGGLDGTALDPIKEFRKNLPMNVEHIDFMDIPPELHQVMNPDCSKLGLIRASLASTEKTWHGENRYLLFLTENYVALDILKHYLNDSMHTNQQLDVAEGHAEVMEPYILFGSSFPKDKEYTQVCRNINQIRVCMESGRTVILLNLENLYESLYDVLNQYYIYNFGNRYVDLGLQTHRVRCRVHDNFKLILIAEKDTVYNQFPTPLINRLEKHFVLTSSILESWQNEVLNRFTDWINKFSITKDGKFNPANAFIGFQTDTPAAIVFQTTHFMRQLRKEGAANSNGWENVRSANALGEVSPEGLIELEEDSEQWKYAVLKLSQYRLLQTASPDAIVRLQRTELASESEEIHAIYFGKQLHSSLDDFLMLHLKCDKDSKSGGLLLQVTTHSHLLSGQEITQLECVIKMNVHSFYLHEFETELDFCNKIGQFFKQEADSNDMLLVIQCDSAYTSSDLIACARYRIYDERAHSDNKGKVHVIFIVFVPHHNTASNHDLSFSSSTVGYLGDPWISAHVDDLRPSFDTTVTPQAALGFSISELFVGKTVSGDGGNIVQSAAPQHRIAPLHRRLQDCIQSSASRLADVTWKRATQRIEILVNLVPKESYTSGDLPTFHGILVQRIAAIMKERDEILDPRKRWVLEQAMDLKKLHTGGTFGNVLARKVDEVIVPIFAYIISIIDQNYNLDLLDTRRQSDCPVSQLWLAVFSDPKVLQLSYNEIATSSDKLLGAGSKKSGEDFKCRLPFSWIIKDTVDALRINAKSAAGDDVVQLHSHLAESVRQTCLGSILDRFSGTLWQTFSEYYLHDFVRMVHKGKHKNEDMEKLEYELIMHSLNALVHVRFDAVINESLLHYIAALHVVYDSSKPKISWFSQLVSFSPGIMLSLRERNRQHQRDGNGSEMVLHLLAVEKLLHDLHPPLKKEQLTQNLVPWLNDIRMCQNTVNSILSVTPQSQWVVELNQNWQLIQAMRMFLEHIMLRHNKVSVKFARRLEASLKQCGPDFLKAESIHRIKDILKQIDRELKSKSHHQHNQVLTSCRDFFMEVVSSLSFGGQTAPEPDLIKSLMETVFAAKEKGTMFSTRDLTPYDHESPCDEVPVVRSFLLQLLLEHNSTVVKTYLHEYFSQSCQALGVQKVDLNLCLLCIQCFEDALSRSFTETKSETSLKMIAETMNEGFIALLDETIISENVSVQFLEGLAKIRFTLSVVAEVMERQTSSKHIVETSAQAKQLVYTTCNVCCDLNVNVIDITGRSDTTGPIVYLMRLLVRQYGMPCLETVADAYSWVIPRQLRNAKVDQEKILDQFVLYNDRGYSNLRECLTTAAYMRQMEPLIQATQSIGVEDTAILLLGVYHRVTLSRVNISPTRQIVPDVLTKLDTYISRLKSMNSEMRRIGRMLIANEQGRHFVCLNVMPGQSKHVRNLAALVVHSAVVFTSKGSLNILSPFVNILQNPAMLVNVYLPTMPEDSLHEVRQAGGQFYQCPRGHPYFVGECGRPMQEYNCNVCGARIGGQRHKLRTDNKEARRNDATRTGHDLGNPNERTVLTSSERQLSPLAVCIIRALLHSAFIWTCSNSAVSLGDVATLVTPSVKPNALPEFFWKHLEKDLEGICAILKRGEDESILLVHLVLKQILTQQMNYASVTVSRSQLSSREGRKQWEGAFNETFIRPITEALDQSIHAAFNSVVNDNEQEHDQLFYLVYERVQVRQGSIVPHMWTFWSKITLENLTQKAQEKSIKDLHPILYEFLQAEPNLRATQYLPDIVHLQCFLYDTFNFHLDRRKAMSTTIGQFIQQMSKNTEKENVKEWIDSLNKAWQLVLHKLKTHGRLRVKDEFLIPMFTYDTPLEYIVPTAVGAGACTTALVDFLTLTHNDFIERCRALTSAEEKNALQLVWSGHKVPITHVNHCHLVIYEQQLQSIILSHCHYSLTAGSSHLVKYDFKALEKHILDRFIHGKPMILADIPQVIYRKDTHTATMFGAIRKKVSPQERLPIRLQQEILVELHTLERVREMLDIVDIVMGFLSSGGGSADKPLGEYVEKVLKMKTRNFSEKIRQNCKLGHIVSLWETLSVELARQLYFRGEEPFDSVDKELLSDLSREEKQELDISLRSFDVKLLLDTLFQFIQTHVFYCPANEFEWMIIDVLPPVLDQWEVPLITDFEEKFPDNIKICQAIATWKCIVLYQKTFKN